MVYIFLCYVRDSASSRYIRRGGWRRLAAPRAGLLAMNVAADLGPGSAAQDETLVQSLSISQRHGTAPTKQRQRRQQPAGHCFVLFD